ncbi:MAG: hypothetical protein FWH27_01055 [Planctomycetaceae bacterium]|nr:hypothetical protein [Planctomycetaceae bacterium]
MKYWKLRTQYSDNILFVTGGNGNLVHQIKKSQAFLGCRDENLDVMESNPALRRMYEEQEIRVVHDDILTFDTLIRYDWIIIAPLSSDGDTIDESPGPAETRRKMRLFAECGIEPEFPYGITYVARKAAFGLAFQSGLDPKGTDNRQTKDERRDCQSNPARGGGTNQYSAGKDQMGYMRGRGEDRQQETCDR